RDRRWRSPRTISDWSGLGKATSSISGRAQNRSPNRSSVQGFSHYHSPNQQLESSAEKPVSCREKKICGPPFFREGSRQLKLFWAILASWRAEWKGRLFFQSGNQAYGSS